MKIHSIRKFKNIRKALRKNMPSSEIVLWSYIKSNQLGYKFRRQHGIGNYVVDFYCTKLKLVVEVDGGTHDIDEVWKKDERKQKYLESLGFTVKRYNSEEVFQELYEVLEDLEETCKLLDKNK